MDREEMRRLDEYRFSQAGPLENDLVDELGRGRHGPPGIHSPRNGAGPVGGRDRVGARRLRHAARVRRSDRPRRRGGRLRVGIIPPPARGSIPTPTRIRAASRPAASRRVPHPGDADADAPAGAGAQLEAERERIGVDVQAAPGVKFQDGQSFSADDVVATYDRLCDPASGSQALSALKGVLSPGGTKKIDDLTIEFHLDAPNANFPYLTSSTTYQGILLPANYKLGTFEKTPQTTGAFKLVSYNPGVGAKYERNTGWWGGTRAARRRRRHVLLRRRGRDLGAARRPDRPHQPDPVRDRPGAVQQLERADLGRSRGDAPRGGDAGRREEPAQELRCVRQAIALTLDRPAIVKTLFNNLADVGNDSPFAPVYPSTDRSVPQRNKNIPMAKQLMAAGGLPEGLQDHADDGEDGRDPAAGADHPALGEGDRDQHEAVHPDRRRRTSPARRTARRTGWGTTPWLNTPMNITDWGHRAVPNVLLDSAFKSKGVWNAAHYSNKKFDTARQLVLRGDRAQGSAEVREADAADPAARHAGRSCRTSTTSSAAARRRSQGYKADAQGQVYLSHTSLA